MNQKPSTLWTLAIAVVAMLVVPLAAQAQGTAFVTNNRFGLGTDNPQAKQHIKSTDAQLLVENSSAAAGTRTLVKAVNKGASLFRFDNSNLGVAWIFGGGNSDSLIFSKNGTGVEFQINAGGNATLAGTLTQGSSRAIKKNFEPVDGREVLAKVAALPIEKWTYQTDATGSRHLGPMAEDFYGAFGLGATDKGIASLDGSGVALAAIQGLNAELAERDERINRLEQQLDRVTQILDTLANSSN